MLRRTMKLARPSLLQLGNAKFYRERFNAPFHAQPCCREGRMEPCFALGLPPSEWEPLPPLWQSMAMVECKNQRLQWGKEQRNGCVHCPLTWAILDQSITSCHWLYSPHFLWLNQPGRKSQCLGKQLKAKETRLTPLDCSNQRAISGLIHAHVENQ